MARCPGYAFEASSEVVMTSRNIVSLPAAAAGNEGLTQATATAERSVVPLPCSFHPDICLAGLHMQQQEALPCNLLRQPQALHQLHL